MRITSLLIGFALTFSLITGVHAQDNPYFDAVKQHLQTKLNTQDVPLNETQLVTDFPFISSHQIVRVSVNNLALEHPNQSGIGSYGYFAIKDNNVLPLHSQSDGAETLLRDDQVLEKDSVAATDVANFLIETKIRRQKQSYKIIQGPADIHAALAGKETAQTETTDAAPNPALTDPASASDEEIKAPYYQDGDIYKDLIFVTLAGWDSSYTDVVLYQARFEKATGKLFVRRKRLGAIKDWALPALPQNPADATQSNPPATTPQP
ncbi:MAG: hypothetical protein H7A33_00445 [Deltaproteobacteria bacterium]|nr:hypothetical protein [Deltaproteobacteria bacterium]